jgi:hypothetical protein
MHPARLHHPRPCRAVRAARAADQAPGPESLEGKAGQRAKMRERRDTGSASVWRGAGDAPPICSSQRARSGAEPRATTRDRRHTGPCPTHRPEGP